MIVKLPHKALLLSPKNDLSQVIMPFLQLSFKYTVLQNTLTCVLIYNSIYFPLKMELIYSLLMSLLYLQFSPIFQILNNNDWFKWDLSTPSTLKQFIDILFLLWGTKKSENSFGSCYLEERPLGSDWDHIKSWGKATENELQEALYEAKEKRTSTQCLCLLLHSVILFQQRSYCHSY